MFYTCPRESAHQSEDPDYCSVCGAKIGASTLGTAPPPAVSGLNGTGTTADICPDCGLARHAGAKFCEVCRYNFETHASATRPAPDAASAPPLSAPLPIPPAPAGTEVSWEAVVAVDPSLYADPDPQVPCPVNEPERTFPLDLAENLIGRRSDRRDIHPEVPLLDSGVSHRHAKILRQQDGGLALLELGSTNGTQLNGKDVPPGERIPLRGGDQITLGCWTRITLRALPKI